MITKTKSGFMARLPSALLTGLLLLSACAPAVPATPLHVTDVPTVVVPTEVTSGFSFDMAGMATGSHVETLPSTAGSDVAPWELLPEYSVVTLEGYPIGDHQVKPQIFIYPAAELGQVNPGAGQIVASLQTLLSSPQEIPNMPFLPLYNATQVFHAQIQYLDFKNGKGLRYVTEFAQGMLPINNYDLIYAYQGLTNDGKYYVAAVLPINHPSLPADGKITGNEPLEFTNDFPAYVANVASSLNTSAANTFGLDLANLDAIMSSLEIK